MFPIEVEEEFKYENPAHQELGPICSVVVASYNYASFVKDTLGSVAAQTYAPLELIIVDDASTDVSTEVIRDWMEIHQTRFKRCLLLRHKVNQGLAQTRNTAFQAAQGKHVFVLDSDNLLFSRCIARHVEVMERTEAAVVYAQSEWFDAVRRVGPSDLWDAERLKTGNYVDAMALVSRAAWESVGGYSHFDMMGWEDYDLWLKFIEVGYEGVFIPEILCRYRVHGNSMNRVESLPKKARMEVEMTLRHPWLRL
ncbi:glycosyltransferase family 2 protein [Bradyrhizobium sp. USDA 4504]